MDRRNFLKKSTGLAAGATLGAAGSMAANTAASAARTLGANDRIRVGLIGCGGMGRTDLRDMLHCMRSRKRPNSDIEIGHNSMIACASARRWDLR